MNLNLTSQLMLINYIQVYHRLIYKSWKVKLFEEKIGVNNCELGLVYGFVLQQNF